MAAYAEKFGECVRVCMSPYDDRIEVFRFIISC